MKGIILDCDSLGPDDLDLSALYALPINWTTYGISSPQLVAERITGADIVLTNKAPLHEAAIKGAPALKLISVLATGTNVIDLMAAKNAGVTVCNVRGYGTGSVVQHTWALILQLTCKIGDYHRDALNGTWQQSPFFCLLNHRTRQLEGKVLGIVGAGELGRGVAKIGEAFGMEVRFAALPGRQYSGRRTPFDELLAEADVLSLHCPLNSATAHLIGERELSRMKRDAILINTARGGIVDEQSLAAALKAGAIAGAATDVLTSEPPRADHPLLDTTIPNLIVTPHCAWVARESRQTLVDQTVDNIRAFLQGSPLRQV